jgi:hypothetical protein
VAKALKVLEEPAPKQEMGQDYPGRRAAQGRQRCHGQPGGKSRSAATILERFLQEDRLELPLNALPPKTFSIQSELTLAVLRRLIDDCLNFERISLEPRRGHLAPVNTVTVEHRVAVCSRALQAQLQPETKIEG